jgi:hypothetical protein
VKPFKVRLCFHGDLGVFLGSKPRDAVIERRLAEKTSIKDIIESCGVPHPEVNLILVDDQTVGFDLTLARAVAVASTRRSGSEQGGCPANGTESETRIDQSRFRNLS